jgi:hypothetical protein
MVNKGWHEVAYGWSWDSGMQFRGKVDCILDASESKGVFFFFDVVCVDQF